MLTNNNSKAVKEYEIKRSAWLKELEIIEA